MRNRRNYSFFRLNPSPHRHVCGFIEVVPLTPGSWLLFLSFLLLFSAPLGRTDKIAFKPLTGQEAEEVVNKYFRINLNLRRPSVAGVIEKERAIIAAFLGEKPTAGYSIRITEMRRGKDAVEVMIEKREPGPETIVAQVITYPYSIAVARADELPEKARLVMLARDGARLAEGELGPAAQRP